MKKIYVGNLPFSASEEKVYKAFSQYGIVHSVKLLTDPVTGRIRGFGFVEMDQDSADAAIKALDGAPFEYRKLRVHEAFEKIQGSQESTTRNNPVPRGLRGRPNRSEAVLTIHGQQSNGNRRYSQPAMRRH